MDRIPLLSTLLTLPTLLTPPPPNSRIPLTPHTLPILLTLPIPILILAHLARYPHTLLPRLAILPFAAFWCLWVLGHVRWMEGGMEPWNFAMGLYCLLALAKTVEFGANPLVYRRVSESSSSKTNGHAKQTNGTANGHSPPQQVASSKPSFKHELLETLDLVSTLRGIGWTHSEGTYIPPFPFPHLSGPALRRRWLLHAWLQYTLSYLLLDALEVLIKQHPNFHHPGPSSIFVPSLPPLERYALAGLMSLATGLAVIMGFQSGYYGIGFLCVLSLSHDPSRWPPVQQAPWASTSLHDFWAKHWHQLIRRSFLIMGGYPLHYLVTPVLGHSAGQVALVVGSFVASGLLHMFAQIPIGRPLWGSSLVFFTLQGVGVGLERVWKIFIGRRVGGVWGWGWCMAWVVGWGVVAVEDWHMHGLGSGIVLPPVLSPMRMVIIPLAKRLLAA